MSLVSKPSNKSHSKRDKTGPTYSEEIEPATPIGRNVLATRAIPPHNLQALPSLEGTDISLQHMEATATQVLENYYTAFPFRQVEETTLSRLIDARVAQMEITSDAM
jgi:hypothetical protein